MQNLSRLAEGRNPSAYRPVSLPYCFANIRHRVKVRVASSRTGTASHALAAGERQPAEGQGG